MAAKIKINGTEYEFPDMQSLTLDEGVLLERHAGITLDQLVPGENVTLGAVKGMIMIAIRRAQPSASEREISEVIGQLKLAELTPMLQTAGEQAEGDADPPQKPSGDAASENTMISGPAGSNGSEPHPEPSTPLDTGMPPSDTSRVLDPAIWAD